MIFVIKLVTNRRRLLRKKMYKGPHQRNRLEYYRENKNFKKPFQEEYTNKESIRTKRRPKREVISGFKMSYRYKYYNQENPEEDEEES